MGAARDLVVPISPDLVYPCGDVVALSTVLTQFCSDPQRLRLLGLAAQRHMTDWSPAHGRKWHRRSGGSTLALAGLFVVGGAILIAILNDWQRGLYVLVGWILFEDFVRKYLGNNMAIYFAKDVLAIALYISYFRAMRAKQTDKFKIPFRLSLLVFFWFCLIQIFNPASPSVFYGILGMKVNFLYVPLIFIGYTFSEPEDNLFRLLSFVCALILIVAGLGLVQSIVGPTFLNPQNLQGDIRDLSTLYCAAPISGLMAYRPSSVFVSAARFQNLLVLAWIISLGFSGYLILRTKRSRTLAFTTVGVVAAASVMSTSRGVVMWNGGTTLLMAAGFL